MCGMAEAAEFGMEIEPLDGGLEGGEEPEGETDAPGGLEDINAAAHSSNGAGGIDRTAGLESGPIRFADGFHGEGLGGFAGEGIAEGLQGS